MIASTTNRPAPASQSTKAANPAKPKLRWRIVFYDPPPVQAVTTVMTEAMKRYLDRSLHDLGLPFKVVAALENDEQSPDANGLIRHVRTVRDLLQLSPADLLAIHNFGERTLVEIYRRLSALGFVKPGYEEIAMAQSLADKKAHEATQRIYRRLNFRG